jgi:diadenosine tetraphosphate (Ap4A) HIT family hydrolase
MCEVLAAAVPGKLVYRDAHWAAITTDVPGWILIMTTRHGEWTWDLTADEASGFGGVVGDVSSAVKKAFGAERVYLLGLGENFLHFHVMVMPRQPEDTEMPIERALHGALFELREKSLDEARAEHVASELRGLLESQEVRTA